MSVELQELQELLLHLCRSLVLQPEEIEVTAIEDNNNIMLKVTCNSADMGRLIGRGGKRAQAIRVLMKAKSAQLDRRIIVDFVD